MITANKEIRFAMKQSRVSYWQIADELGVCDTTLMRWMRHELPEEKRNQIFDIINKILVNKGKYRKEKLNEKNRF